MDEIRKLGTQEDVHQVAKKRYEIKGFDGARPVASHVTFTYLR